MLNNNFMSQFSDESLKRFRLVSGILFFGFYAVLGYIVYMAKLDMLEYNYVWLSVDTQVLNEYYASMAADGRFFYYTTGHILDMFFALIYTSFFLSIAELTKRTSVSGKKHWKIASIFIVLIAILPFLDWFETGMLLATVSCFPNIPLWLMYGHIVGKLVASLVYYPLIVWFVYLIIRAIFRKIKGI